METDQNKIFWEAIDNVQEEDLKNQDNAFITLEKATELGVWLHTEFQCKMEEATELMNLEAKDETKPFDEKYKARDILQNLRKNEYLSDKYAKLFDQVSAENVSENDSVS